MEQEQRPEILIIEDEPLILESLAESIKKIWPGTGTVYTASDGEIGWEIIKEKKPLVIFSDISMPGKSGLDIADDLYDMAGSQSYFPRVVFVSAYDQYALRAFQVDVFDYLLKPVSDEKLKKTIAKIKRSLAPALPEQEWFTGFRELVSGISESGNKPLERINVSVGNEIYLIRVETIRLLKSSDKYIEVFTDKPVGLIRRSLKNLMDSLDSAIFKQVHRSYAVNMNFVEKAIKSDNSYLLRITGLEEPVPVSGLRSYLFKSD